MHSWQNHYIPISVCELAGYTNNEEIDSLRTNPNKYLLNSGAVTIYREKAGQESSPIWVCD